jgi:predicted metalloprotease with PDZ domain
MSYTRTLLSSALTVALLLPIHTTAQTSAPGAAPPAAASDAQKRAELDRAQQDFMEARKRVMELRRELGEDAPGNPRREVRIVTATNQAMIGLVFGEDSNGVYVRAVTPGGGADKAGVRAGDRLIAINGKDVAATAKADSERSPIQAARRLVGRPKDGEAVRLTISRDGKRQDLVATAEKRSVFAWSGDGSVPPRLRERLRELQGLEGLERLEGIDVDVLVERALERAELSQDMAGRRVMMFREGAHDVRFAAVNPDLGKYFGATSGVLVLEQKNDRFAPLMTGDVITSVGGEPVESPIDVTRALRRHEPGTRINVEVVRDRKRQVLVMSVPERPSAEMLWPATPAPPAPPAAPAAPAAPSAPPAPANAGVVPAPVAPAAFDTLEV